MLSGVSLPKPLNLRISKRLKFRILFQMFEFEIGVRRAGGQHGDRRGERQEVLDVL
jgi:hypothetical protein